MALNTLQFYSSQSERKFRWRGVTVLLCLAEREYSTTVLISFCSNFPAICPTQPTVCPAPPALVSPPLLAPPPPPPPPRPRRRLGRSWPSRSRRRRRSSPGRARSPCAAGPTPGGSWRAATRATRSATARGGRARRTWCWPARWRWAARCWTWTRRARSATPPFPSAASRAGPTGPPSSNWRRSSSREDISCLSDLSVCLSACLSASQSVCLLFTLTRLKWVEGLTKRELTARRWLSSI